MRIGFNPNKNKALEGSNYNHQVIIPVYIPNQEGYFKDSLQILKYCLVSLFKTCHMQTYFTIVANGCCEDVLIYLNDLKYKGKIHELINTTAIGKVNAILKGLVGHNFPLITITDADVLFLNGWQNAVQNIYESFPKAGAVCTTPSSRSFNTNTANVYWDNFFSNRLRFSEVLNPEALKAFANSIGNSDFYNEIQLSKYLTLTCNGQQAVVGAGHFVTTYRREVFNKLEKTYSDLHMGGSVMREFLDLAVVKQGLWRLSTCQNYSYHMGNVKEDWMRSELDNIITNESKGINVKLETISKPNFCSYFIKNRLFGKLIFNKKVLAFYFRIKGLNKKEIQQYFSC